ncbi:MAG TPA: glycosidase [Firmicutes bacterium]|nr:glycosidase [Bacillota bacterium]
MFRLERISNSPVLEPRRENQWEQGAVFNTAVVYKDGYFHLLYRASDRDFEALRDECPKAEKKFCSVIGLAKSRDGINFERNSKPLFVGQGVQEAWGVEDPRVTKIGDTYYMVYTSFGGRSWNDHRISLASSKNLVDWRRHGVLLDEVNKDGGLLADKINGKYVLFHRREPNIWVAFSDDLKIWYDHQIVMTTLPNGWETKKIGIAGEPILIEQGYLMIYHAVDDRHVYRLGAALLDRSDPTKVLARLPEPILEPELAWERTGNVPNVVFSCGQAVYDGYLYVYYGAADTVIGAARVALDQITFK